MKWLNRNQKILCLAAGLMAMLVSVVPNLILGADAIYTYHDQLDGELIAYILQARNLFGEGLPEFLGGSPKTALTLPAPVFVLLFLGKNYHGALLLLQLLGRIVGFAGMYLLAKKLTGKPVIAMAAGVLYGLLPFLAVYGFSQYGLPLLVWSILSIREKKYLFWAYGYVALYGLGSSLVLVGFGVLGMGVLWLLWDLWQYRSRRYETNGKGFLAAWLLLLGIYVAENATLLAQMLGIAGEEVSHKAEYVLRPTAFWSGFWERLFYGGQHSQGYQGLLAAIGIGVMCTGITLLVGKRIQAGRALLKSMGICLGCNVFFALAASVWSLESVVEIRTRMGALGAFQLERLLWMAPCLWYLFAACAGGMLVELWKAFSPKMLRLALAGCLTGLTLATALTGLEILLAGDIKSNVQKLRNPDYSMMSFGEYYAVGVLEQVEVFLAEETGKEQAEYRVVSLGIDPAAALYHGFYCLDGYSNNYSLAYKHKFREVIAPELEKSEYLREYFDEWGNRCYLFSAECPGYYTIEKNGFYFQQYQLNGVALKEMGCDYLFSAAYIMDGEAQGLRLMREEPFETSDSYYRIYVYEICE